jgi:uncharacterized protein YlxW (UPF0749 family)
MEDVLAEHRSNMVQLEKQEARCKATINSCNKSIDDFHAIMVQRYDQPIRPDWEISASARRVRAEWDETLSRTIRNLSTELEDANAQLRSVRRQQDEAPAQLRSKLNELETAAREEARGTTG